VFGVVLLLIVCPFLWSRCAAGVFVGHILRSCNDRCVYPNSVVIRVQVSVCHVLKSVRDLRKCTNLGTDAAGLSSIDDIPLPFQLCLLRRVAGLPPANSPFVDKFIRLTRIGSHTGTQRRTIPCVGRCAASRSLLSSRPFTVSLCPFAKSLSQKPCSIGPFG
jgi:hypothetical protein